MTPRRGPQAKKLSRSPPTPPHPAVTIPAKTESSEPYLGGAVIEADLVPDDTPQRTAHLLGHPLRHRDGGNAPGLGDANGPELGKAYGRDGENRDSELCCSESVYTQVPT